MDPEDSPTPPPDREDATITGDPNPALLRALIARIAARYLAIGGPTPSPAHLLVGQLPELLPVPLPLPEDSTIVGTLLRGPYGLTVFLDAPLSPDAVRTFFRERLTAAGWTLPAPNRHMPRAGGFLHVAGADGERLLFCQGPRGPALWLQADPATAGRTPVQLELVTDARHTPCAPQQRAPDPWAALPPLAAPPSAQQFPEGCGSSSDMVYTHARLRTDLDLAAVAAYYTTQLEQAGWRRADAGEAGPLAWSGWAFQQADGQDWQGLLTILARPGRPGEFLLALRADWAAASDAGGWSSGWSVRRASLNLRA